MHSADFTLHFAAEISTRLSAVVGIECSNDFGFWMSTSNDTATTTISTPNKRKKR